MPVILDCPPYYMLVKLPLHVLLRCHYVEACPMLFHSNKSPTIVSVQMGFFVVKHIKVIVPRIFGRITDVITLNITAGKP